MNKQGMCETCKHFRANLMPWCLKYSVPVMTTIKSNGVVAGKAARCVKEKILTDADGQIGAASLIAATVEEYVNKFGE